MTPDQIRSEVESYFASHWVPTRIKFANVPMEPPPQNNETWVRLILRPGQVFGKELGTGALGERVCVVFVDIFVPLYTGTSWGWVYAGQVENMFRNKSLGGVEFGEPYSEDVGETEVWNQFAVTIPAFAWVGE